MWVPPPLFFFLLLFPPVSHITPVQSLTIPPSPPIFLPRNSHAPIQWRGVAALEARSASSSSSRFHSASTPIHASSRATSSSLAASSLPLPLLHPHHGAHLSSCLGVTYDDEPVRPSRQGHRRSPRRRVEEAGQRGGQIYSPRSNN